MARIEVAPAGGPYAYRTLGALLHLQDVTDLRVRPHGPVRLAHIAFAG
ncbi:hypothetical protein [Streptomyces sp. NK15101]|nr:hypothetical protein [Streptomyces sp. NK15101]